MRSAGSLFFALALLTIRNNDVSAAARAFVDTCASEITGISSVSATNARHLHTRPARILHVAMCLHSFRRRIPVVHGFIKQVAMLVE